MLDLKAGFAPPKADGVPAKITPEVISCTPQSSEAQTGQTDRQPHRQTERTTLERYRSINTSRVINKEREEGSNENDQFKESNGLVTKANIRWVIGSLVTKRF